VNRTTASPPSPAQRQPGGARTWPLLAAWALVTVVLTAVVALSNPLSKGEYEGAASFAGPGLLRGWYQFDAGWYEVVATEGYYLVAGQSPVAFFPGYPLAVRALMPLFGDRFAVTAIALSAACGAAAVVLFARWCRARLDPRAGPWAVALLLVYPYNWYLFGAIYADALFLLATLAAFLAVERGRPVLAGLAGAVAAATRPVGPAVVIGLVLLAIERRGALRTLAPDPPPAAGRVRRLAHRWELPCGVEWRRLRPIDLGVGLSALGFGAYAGYLWVRFGDPLAFSSVQRYWDQPTGPVTWAKGHLVANLFVNPISKARYLAGCLFQGALTIGALVLVPRVARRFGWGYAALVLFGMGLPALGSKDFQGTGRYLLAAFPVFALAGEWLAHQSGRRRTWVLGTSAVLLLLLTHLYARGYYIA
jgi:hypothetical protein